MANVQERLQILLGAQAMQIVALQARVEELQEQLNKLQPKPVTGAVGPRESQ